MLHSNNLKRFRGKFPGLQGSYADERTGEIVLEICTPEPQGADAPLRMEMTTAKLVPAILNRAP